MQTKEKKTILSGMQPTNFPTLGNYLGALKNWAELQDEYHCIFLVVDLHAITATRPDPSQLRESTRQLVALYLAVGLDPEKCTFVAQSHVSQHAELSWVLTCSTYMGELNRMTQFKDKSEGLGKSIGVGLYTYPVLMAADILLYQADLVPVGQDQKQHIELCRDLAMRMNHHYGEDLFTIPEPYIPKVGAKVMDLQEPSKKMSKSASSEGGAIYLTDSDKVIVKKVKRAVTDSGTEIRYSDEQLGIKNLIDIQRAITGKSVEEIVAEYEGKMYGHLKVETGEMIAATIGPIRDQAEEYLKDPDFLNQVFSKGAERAGEIAEKTLRQVYDRIGFLPKSNGL